MPNAIIGGFLRDTTTGALVISGGAAGVNVADTKNAKLRPATAVSETFSRLNGSSNGSPLTSGTLRLNGLMYIPAATAVTNLVTISATTAAVTPTNQWFCLVRMSDLTVLAVTVDDTVNAWAANTVKSLAVNAGPWIPSQDEWCYFGIMVAAATAPSLFCNNLINGTLAGLGTPVMANATAGLTTPIATGGTVSLGATGTLVSYAYAT